jgi:hypothetical protein
VVGGCDREEGAGEDHEGGLSGAWMSSAVLVLVQAGSGLHGLEGFFGRPAAAGYRGQAVERHGLG